MSTPPALAIRDLSVRRGRRVIVDGVSLEHHAGTVAWLVGENGSGKTSLMRVLAGLDAPDAGTVKRVAGKGRSTLGSYYHPDMRLPGGVRVTDWRAMVGRLGLPEHEAPGLTPPFARPTIRAGGLSTGEEKRLALDAILANGRDFVFLDEPYEHLSPEGKDLLTDRLGRLAATRVVVVATNQVIPGPLEGGPVIRLHPGED